MSRIRLSQCMIVKNEEATIQRALSWGKGIVCEQIVVDTGSTDRTVELAEAMGAKVFHFPWIHDFSAAKNYAIDQAQGDWIAFLDADEYFQEEDVRKILPLLEKLKEKTGDYKAEVISTCLVSLDDEGHPISETRQHRLFQNKEAIRYYNRIHEQLGVMAVGKKRDPIGLDASQMLKILHTGYGEQVYQATRKLDRNISMLKREVEEDPGNWKMKVYLAESLSIDHHDEEAKALLDEVYEKGLMRLEAASQNILFSSMMKDMVDRGQPEDQERLLEVFQAARDLKNFNPDFDFFLGLWFLKRGEYERVLSHMQKALELESVFRGTMSYRLTSQYDTLYHAMTQASLKLKRYGDVVRYGVLCLRAQPYTTEVLMTLLTLLKDEPGEAEHGAGTFGILDQIYDFTKMKDKMYVQRSAEAVGFFKLAEIMKSLMPPEAK